jgi:putative transposase
MRYDSERHHRRSIRLKGYDYRQVGGYFITLVTQDRACLFGEVVDGEMRMNEYGQIAWEEWFRSAEIRREIRLYPDEFVVMPNHIHGIVWIVEPHVGATGPSPLPNHSSPNQPPPLPNGLFLPSSHPRGPARQSLSSFIGGYKSAVTKQINALRGAPGAPVWQRNYYEHIIRNEDDLEAIRYYILTNPSRWHEDRENPHSVGAGPFV